MSNLVKLLNDNGISDTHEAIEFMGTLNVNVRYLGDLVRFHHTKDSDLSIPAVRECAGIILETGTWDVVCYGMDTFYDESEFDLSVTGSTITEAIDGSLIRCYYYKYGWKIATTKSIDAGQAYWSSPKSFKTLFFEAISNNMYGSSENFFENLDKKCTYSFILQHPESRNVAPIISTNIFHVSTRNNITLNEEPTGSLKNVRTPNQMTGIKPDTAWWFQGVVVQTPDFRRCKVKNTEWEKVSEIKGNYANVARRFLEIKDDASAMVQFLKYFPEYTSAFDELTSLLINLPELLWNSFKYYMIEQNERMTKNDYLYSGVMALYVRFKKSEMTEPTTIEVVQDYISNCSNEELARVLGFV